jgi:hypothetical protein
MVLCFAAVVWGYHGNWVKSMFYFSVCYFLLMVFCTLVIQRKLDIRFDRLEKLIQGTQMKGLEYNRPITDNPSVPAEDQEK